MTKAIEIDFVNAWIDEFGAKYSADKKKLLSVPNLSYYEIQRGTEIICDNAFVQEYSCLKTVVIPDSVIAIGESSFKGCRQLTSIHLPFRISQIGENAFHGCYGLTSIVLPSNLTQINKNTFAFCSNLISVYIPNNVTHIEEFAFCMCTGLKYIVLPVSVSYISDTAFADCRGIDTFYVDANNPNYISIDGCIYNRDANKIIKVPEAKESCSLPEGLECIGSRAFMNCKNLRELIIPNQVSTIESYAFYGCRQIHEINLSKQIVHVGKYAFSGCTKMTLACSELPPQLKSVEDYAFKDCQSITAIKFTSSIEKLGDGVFSGCINLEFCQMPDAYLRIPDFFFIGCNKLNKLFYSSQIEYIGHCAFTDCVSLRKIEVPQTCTTLSGNPFGGLNRDCIVIDSPYFKLEKGLLIDLKNKAIISYFPEKATGDVIIPEGIVSISASAFAKSDIGSISLPFSLENIETMAFAGCKNIKEVVFKSHLSKIEKGAFHGCTGMTYIHFDDGENDLVLGDELFSSLDNLEIVDLPDNLKEIPHRTFYKCVKLRKIKLPSRLQKIGIRSFEECVSLEFIRIPEATLSIEDRAFQTCGGLVRAELLYSKTELGIGVFAYCFNLRGIIIPQGSKSFYRKCTDIELWPWLKERLKGKLHY